VEKDAPSHRQTHTRLRKSGLEGTLGRRWIGDRDQLEKGNGVGVTPNSYTWELPYYQLGMKAGSRKEEGEGLEDLKKKGEKHEKVKKGSQVGLFLGLGRKARKRSFSKQRDQEKGIKSKRGPKDGGGRGEDHWGVLQVANGLFVHQKEQGKTWSKTRGIDIGEKVENLRKNGKGFFGG